MEMQETTETETQRSYAEYQENDHLSFDPMKDLNLPASYEEAVYRYRRLRHADEQASYRPDQG